MPIFYECQRCTACCRWPGEVRLNEGELARLAAFKNLSESHFIQQFMRLRPDRQGLALAEKSNGECIFLDGKDCSVQPVKPQQCRDFPNLWNFPGFEKTCQAIPKLVSDEEYQRRVAQAVSRRPYPCSCEAEFPSRQPLPDRNDSEENRRKQREQRCFNSFV